MTKDVTDLQILPVRLGCISCSTSLLLTLMFDIYSHLDIWYVMDRGRDKDGCGRSLQFPCNTLLYLLQHLPPSNLNVWYLFSLLDTWYVMDRGRDKDRCGRSPDSPWETLLYLLQYLPPSNTNSNFWYLFSPRHLVRDGQRKRQRWVWQIPAVSLWDPAVFAAAPPSF